MSGGQGAGRPGRASSVDAKAQVLMSIVTRVSRFSVPAALSGQALPRDAVSARSAACAAFSAVSKTLLGLLVRGEGQHA
ncbi:hypothetical protein VTI74DRAFT_8605 [Chaetomium olivicolor]